MNIIESLFPIESWQCPICHDPLLDPVVTDDGFLYNKNCFIRYCNSTQRGLNLKSPVCEKKISEKYSEVHHIRSCVLNLITGTNMFDEWLKDINCDQIKDYNLINSLIKSKKIDLVVNHDVKQALFKFNIIDILKSDYIRAIDMIKQHKINPTEIWINVLENQSLEQHALGLMKYF